MFLLYRNNMFVTVKVTSVMALSEIAVKKILVM